MSKSTLQTLAVKSIEPVAVVCSLLYTYLYIEGSVWCWAFASIASVLYIVLTWQKKILAESFVHLFYLAMAVYGYMNMGGEFPPPLSLALSAHLIWIALAFGGVFLTGYLLKRWSKAHLPFIDSFTTVFSILATWLMVNNIHENWLYFIVIDLVAIFLYYSRGMRLSSLLYVLYLILALKGYFGL